MECKKIDPNKSLVRVLNACDWLESVDVYSNGKILYSNVKFKDFTSYAYFPKGNHKIDVFRAGTLDNPVIKTSINIPVSEIFTIAVAGEKDNATLVVIDEDIEQQPSPKEAIARTINLMPTISPVELLFNGQLSLTGVEYRDITLYAFIPPGKYEVSLESNETGTIIMKAQVDFKTMRIYSLYLIENNEKAELILSVDGNTYVCL